jgi:hypothetical protein
MRLNENGYEWFKSLSPEDQKKTKNKYGFSKDIFFFKNIHYIWTKETGGL